MHAHYHLFRNAFQVKPQIDKTNAIAYGMYKTSLNDSGYATILIMYDYRAFKTSVHY